jgi:hypothetical protein
MNRMEKAIREIIETWMVIGDATPEQYTLLQHNKKIIWTMWPELASMLEDLVWKYIEQPFDEQNPTQEPQNTEDISGQRQETPEEQ